MTESADVRLPESPYAFRPAKRIQRLMFCDALRNLRILRPIEDYQYVGLGHWQFVDFELMRREVGVRRMWSIERNTREQARFEENTPFDEIELLFGDAYECLQHEDLDLSQATIAWLDYTSALTTRTLQDLRLLVEQLAVGSVVAVTFNCHPGREDQRLDTLERQLGTLPGDIVEDDLDADGRPRVQRRILDEQINKTASERGDGVSVEQFMFLRYADRAPMAFWAGVVSDGGDEIGGLLTVLARLEQFCNGGDFIDISVPVLSTREVIGLNKDIRVGEQPSVRGVSDADCEAYGRLHRWYPPVPLPF